MALTRRCSNDGESNLADKKVLSHLKHVEYRWMQKLLNALDITPRILSDKT
jgi:hypothetical protein